MRTPPLALVLAVAMLGALAPSGVRAEDAAPPGMPPPPPKVKDPFTLSLAGDWDLKVKAGGKELAGAAKWHVESDGATLVEEMRAGEGEAAFFGLGVLTQGTDGKSVKNVWFDTEGGAGAWVFEGALSGEGWALEGDMPGGGKAKMTMKKSGEGAVLTMTAGDATLFEITYAKAAKPIGDLGSHPTKALKHPFADAMVGAWDFQATIEMEGGMFPYDGKVEWRRAVGASGLVAVTETNMGPMGVDRGFAVARFDLEKKVMNFWGWPSTRPPTRMQGALTDTSWEAKSESAGSMGPMTMTIKKTDAGFETAFAVGAMKGTERHTRRK